MWKLVKTANLGDGGKRLNNDTQVVHSQYFPYIIIHNVIHSPVDKCRRSSQSLFYWFIRCGKLPSCPFIRENLNLLPEKSSLMRLYVIAEMIKFNVRVLRKKMDNSKLLRSNEKIKPYSSRDDAGE
jgi:hypothetical protein